MAFRPLGQAAPIWRAAYQIAAPVKSRAGSQKTRQATRKLKVRMLA
jgi:hypothetical protein